MAHKKIKCMKLTLEDLKALDKEELIAKFIQIQDHNTQLKNLLLKYQGDSDISSSQQKRQFDFSKYGSHKILLRFLYLGWGYQGYATVEDNVETVEHRLMQALLKCCLIQSRETCDYHRCGRTDKGVSAFSQVISLVVRKGKEGEELDYCSLLNRVLPPEIRVTGWCPCAPTTSARFNCTVRSYTYLFPQANLNLQAMREASLYLKGSHDFRNLCKMDVANGVTNFVREIKRVEISSLPRHSSSLNGYQMCQAVVEGSGFLWHQVRCIMSVLFMVGQGLESPLVVSQLLDIDSCPRKPQYSLSSDIGLCLMDTEFDVETAWQLGRDQLLSVISTLQRTWTTFAIKEEMVRLMLDRLDKGLGCDAPRDQALVLLEGKQSRQHIPLLLRNKCQSLEERVDHYQKKLKLDKPVASENE